MLDSQIMVGEDKSINERFLLLFSDKFIYLSKTLYNERLWDYNTEEQSEPY